MKLCVSCGQNKPLDAYYRDNRYLDSPPRPACKDCINKRQRTPRRTRHAQPKTCSQCGLLKPPHEFVKEPRHADGLRSNCKTCFYSKERYERDQTWRSDNPERVRTYNQRSAPARNAWTKEWQKRNPEKVQAQWARRSARKRNAPVRDFTGTQWKAMKAAYKQCCAYCGKKQQRLTMDHVIPLVRGGLHTASNIVPACKSCNSRKNAGEPFTHQPLLVH